MLVTKSQDGRLFEEIVGYDHIKRLFRLALESDSTTHIRLTDPSMGWFLYFYIVLRSVYDLQIVLGGIIMGLGALRVFQERRLGEYNRGISEENV